MSTQTMSTYSPEITQLLRKKNTRDKMELHKTLTRELPLKLGAQRYLLDIIRLNIVFLNKTTQESSDIKEINVPFDNYPHWFDNLLNQFNVPDIFIITSAGKESIKGISREQLSKYLFVYAETTALDSSDILEIPHYFKPQKSEIVDNWFAIVITQLNAALFKLLSNIKPMEFSELLNQDKLMIFVETTINGILKDENVYQDGLTYKMEQFFDRYLHIRSSDLEHKLLVFFNNTISTPLQCLLYFSISRFMGFVNVVHITHKKDQLPIKMTKLEFESFWKNLLDEFFEIVMSKYTVDHLVNELTDSDISSLNLMNSCKEYVNELIYKKEKTESSNEYDAYSEMFKHVDIPLFYKWAVDNTIPHLETIKSQLEDGRRLTLLGEKKATVDVDEYFEINKNSNLNLDYEKKLNIQETELDELKKKIMLLTIEMSEHAKKESMLPHYEETVATLSKEVTVLKNNLATVILKEENNKKTQPMKIADEILFEKNALMTKRLDYVEKKMNDYQMIVLSLKKELLDSQKTKTMLFDTKKLETELTHVIENKGTDINKQSLLALKSEILALKKSKPHTYIAIITRELNMTPVLRVFYLNEYTLATAFSSDMKPLLLFSNKKKDTKFILSPLTNEWALISDTTKEIKLKQLDEWLDGDLRLLFEK